MKTNNKKIILSALLAMFSAALSVSAVSLTAQADTTADDVQAITMAEATVAMEYGASARISSDGYSGLRYTLEVSATDYQGLKKTYGENISFGIIIAPESYEKDHAEFNEETVFGANEKTPTYGWATYNEETGKWVYEGDKVRVINLSSTELAPDVKNADRYVLYGSISNLNPVNYTTEFIGVGYVQYVEAGETKYEFLAENDNVRSMAYVAQVYQELDSITAEDKTYVFDTYIDGAADQEDTFYTVKHMLSDGNGNYTEATEATETVTPVKINGLTDAPTAKTFAGYTFDEDNAANGKADEIVYANGKTELNLYYVNNMVNNVTQEDKTYTVTGNDSLYRNSFAYTTNSFSDTAVYSVKITVPDTFTSYWGSNWSTFGLIMTNGTVISGKTFDNNAEKTVDAGTYYSVALGLTPVGISSWDGIPSKTRRLDGSNAWDTTTVNDICQIGNGVTEKTFTVVLYNDTLYMYVDNVFVTSISAYSNYFSCGGYSFTKGGSYMFGVNVANLHSSQSAQLELVTEKYGDDALAEIVSNSIYFSNIFPKSYGISGSNNVYTTITGTNTNTADGGKATYMYTSENSSDKVVYSVKVSAPQGLARSYNQDPLVGITMMNGQFINDSSAGVANHTYNSIIFGFSDMGLVQARNVNAGWFRRLDDTGGGAWDFSTVKSDYALKGTSKNTGGVTERTLTVVIYGGYFYVYVDNALVRTLSLEDGTYFGDAYGCTYNANDMWTLGVCTARLYHTADTNPITFTVLKEAYGDDAETEITTNSTYSNITVS